MMKNRSYKYRFYPDAELEQLLAQTFGCTRVVYNSILRYRTDAFFEHQQRINYADASARLTAMKKESEFNWLNDVSCVPLQQALRHQQTAFNSKPRSKTSLQAALAILALGKNTASSRLNLQSLRLSIARAS